MQSTAPPPRACGLGPDRATLPLMLELETTHSHLYPGARGQVVAGAVADGPVTLIFADGACAASTLTGGCLHVAAHETAKGTAIAAKSWAIAFEGPDFRITARTE